MFWDLSALHLAEKTGGVQQIAEFHSIQQRMAESYFAADPPAASEEIRLVLKSVELVGDEMQVLDHSFREKSLWRLDALGLFGEQEVRQLLADGNHGGLPKYVHRLPVDGGANGTVYEQHPDSMVAYVLATRLLASSDLTAADTGCFGTLPAAGSPTLHAASYSHLTYANPRPVVAQALEQLSRHTEALAWAQAELSCPVNFNLPSRALAGRVLGRCHAALGQGDLSASAFDAALRLAKGGEHLVSAALRVFSAVSARCLSLG